MRRTKITLLITFSAVFAYFLVSSPLLKGRGLGTDPSGSGSVVASFPSLAGAVLQPGQYATIKWSLDGDGVRNLESNPWSECELFFSNDGGMNWSRVSPQLSVTNRTFQWWVPSTPTQQGKLALHIGIEGDGEFYIFPSPSFTILPGSR